MRYSALLLFFIGIGQMAHGAEPAGSSKKAESSSIPSVGGMFADATVRSPFSPASQPVLGIRDPMSDLALHAEHKSIFNRTNGTWAHWIEVEVVNVDSTPSAQRNLIVLGFGELEGGGFGSTMLQQYSVPSLAPGQKHKWTYSIPAYRTWVDDGFIVAFTTNDRNPSNDTISRLY